MNIKLHDVIVISLLLNLSIKIEVLFSGFRNSGPSDAMDSTEITDQQLLSDVVASSF